MTTILCSLNTVILTMGEDEAEEELIVDEPDDDFGRAILDATDKLRK